MTTPHKTGPALLPRERHAMAFCRASPHRGASHALLGLPRAILGLPKGHPLPSTPPLPFLQTLLSAPPHRRHRELPRGLWVEEEAPEAPMPGACPSLARVLLSLLDHFLALCPLFVLIFPRPCSSRPVARCAGTAPALGLMTGFRCLGLNFQKSPEPRSQRSHRRRHRVSTGAGLRARASPTEPASASLALAGACGSRFLAFCRSRPARSKNTVRARCGEKLRSSSRTVGFGAGE